MNTDDVQYLDWQWVEEHPESALDLMLKLHSENAALRSLIDDPNAMHSHYLRECNGWEVWQAERIRQFQDANEQLEQLETENAALREDKEILDWMNNNIQAIMFKYKPDGFTWDFREIIGDAMSKEAKP